MYARVCYSSSSRPMLFSVGHGNTNGNSNTVRNILDGVLNMMRRREYTKAREDKGIIAESHVKSTTQHRTIVCHIAASLYPFYLS